MGCFPSDRGCERRSESSIEKHSPAKYCSAEQYRLCCKAISYISGYVVLNRLYCRISTAAFSAPGTFIVGHWQLLQSIAVRMKSPASEDRFETYYSILGVSRTASTAEIDR